MSNSTNKKKRKYNFTITTDIIDIYKLVIIGKEAFNEEGIRGKSRFPAGCWSEQGKEERGYKAVKYMLDVILDWSHERICKELTTQTFVDNHLKGCLANVFGNSVYKALNAVRTGEFMPWELLITKRNYWIEETGRKATKWLIKKRLKWNKKQVRRGLNYQVFEDNDLGGMLAILYDDSPYKALEDAFPGKFMPWELSKCPQRFWTIETGAQAIAWLIIVKLKWSRKIVCKYYTSKLIRKFLGSVLKDVFDDSPFKGLEAAFPKDYMPWELSSCPQGFWNDKENIFWAFNWLKKKFEKPTGKDFENNGLGGILNHKFDGNVRKALAFVY